MIKDLISKTSAWVAEQGAKQKSFTPASKIEKTLVKSLEEREVALEKALAEKDWNTVHTLTSISWYEDSVNHSEIVSGDIALIKDNITAIKDDIATIKDRLGILHFVLRLAITIAVLGFILFHLLPELL